MTVRVYRHDDASAPLLSAAAGSLLGVLDACLVNGYGAKTAAGWEIAFTGTNLRAYRAPEGLRYYLRVADTATATTARVVGYETMTDINTGTGDYPTGTQISGGGYFRKSDTTGTTTYRPWMVIADERRLYLYVGQATLDSAGIAGSTTYAMLYFFGDIISYLPGDTGHSLLLCGAGTGATAGSYTGSISASQAALAGHYMARAHTLSPGSARYSKAVDPRGSPTTIGTAGVAYPEPLTAGMLMAPIFVCEPSNRVTRGYLPGAWAPLHALPGSPGDTFTGRGELTGKEFILLDAANASVRSRIALEISDTWS